MSARSIASCRIGVDIGGTFTDLVLIDESGRVSVHKVSSSTGDYSKAILDGLAPLMSQTGANPGDVAEIVHGTTVATNTILEQKGARTGLITTQGFRDVLELGRLRAPDIYNIHYTKPPPLVERYLRLEVAERVAHDGSVLEPLDLRSLEPILARFEAERVDSVAVCLLHSYANPAHEQAVGRVLRERLPHCYVSLSSDVLPEIKEYERTSTTVINAYIQPAVSAYLERLSGSLVDAGYKGRLLVMQSGGGVMSARAATQRPMHIVESGPAAGVVAAAGLAKRLGLPNLLTLDMGGTTAKASAIEGGEVRRTSQCEVGAGITVGTRLASGGGYFLGTPAIDVAEVGAGGGSLIWIDPGGTMKVGPASAGAVPGPACYGQGNDRPTVTDANLVLGYLNPDYLVGGGLRLYAERAHRALADHIATPLGLDTMAAALGAHLIAAANMMRAVRAISTERGRDPRDFVLCAFGGNGPIFAAGIARSLGVRRVVVPPYPGLFSAFGLLFTDVAYDFVRTHLRLTRDLRDGEVARAFAGMEAEAIAALSAEGYSPAEVGVSRSADLRYAGQRYELTVGLPSGDLGDGGATLDEAFFQEHQRSYGYLPHGRSVQLVNLRVTVRAAVAADLPLDDPRPASSPADLPRDNQHPASSSVGAGGSAGPPARGGTASTISQRSAYFGPEHGLLDTPVLQRADLPRDGSILGPVIVEDYDATTVVPPKCAVCLHSGNVISIEVGQ